MPERSDAADAGPIARGRIVLKIESAKRIVSVAEDKGFKTEPPGTLVLTR